MSVLMYSTRYCPWCIRARRLFGEKGLEFEDIAVDGNAELRREMTARSGRHTVPQIWIGSTHIGGCDELLELERKQALDALLEE